jgi:hypothetical protein
MFLIMRFQRGQKDGWGFNAIRQILSLQKQLLPFKTTLRFGNSPQKQ